MSEILLSLEESRIYRIMDRIMDQTMKKLTALLPTFLTQVIDLSISRPQSVALPICIGNTESDSWCYFPGAA
jgi:hypothetical protein